MLQHSQLIGKQVALCCTGHTIGMEYKPGRHRQPVTQGLRETSSLASIYLGINTGAERDKHVASHASISTTPRSPSTTMRAPSGMREVASPVPTTAEIPHSRATMAV